jgi:D-serine deaminase-like pyridoxal phosphate-dependent protein
VRFDDLPTPTVLVDEPRLHANLQRMQSLASAAGLKLRPHSKTHKSPVIAGLQIHRGATGICCAKVGEAEVFAAAGVTDIRLPYPVSPTNAPRILELMNRATLSIIVDHEVVARGWSDAMRAAGRTLDVLVKVDVGFHRCGIAPDPATGVAFLETIASLRGLRLRGILSHAGHAYGATSDHELAVIAHEEARLLSELASAARAAGIELEEISVGATPTARYSVHQPGVTEMRPGNYVFFDRTQVGLGSAR